MTKNLTLLIPAFFGVLSLFSQAPAIQWQKTIGGSGSEGIAAIRQTAEGGYIMGGLSTSDISGSKSENSRGYDDYWVVKSDADGNIQFQKTLGGNGIDQLRSLQQTADGGYILGGKSHSGLSGDKTENSRGFYDYWVIKLDAGGNIQWQKTIGGADDDELYALQQTADGGYILGGYSSSDISGDKTENNLGFGDFWVVKLDAVGNIEWQNTIGGSDGDVLYALQQTADGGYLLGGTSKSDISGDKTEHALGLADDFWVLKLDAVGNIEWQKTIGGSDYEILYALQQTVDGGYLIGGISTSNISGDKTENDQGGFDYWVLKLNATGDIEWQNTIGGNDFDQLRSLQQTADGGYILGGVSISNISGDKTENSLGYTDYWVIKLDAAGNIQWQNTIGGSADESLASVRQTSDGGYILGGFSTSDISGDKTENSQGTADFWVLKLSPDLVPTAAPFPGREDLALYPNPTDGVVFARTTTAIHTTLYNVVGQTISRQTIGDGSKLNLSGLSEGLYFLVETETGIAHKILKIRQMP